MERKLFEGRQVLGMVFTVFCCFALLACDSGSGQMIDDAIEPMAADPQVDMASAIAPPDTLQRLEALKAVLTAKAEDTAAKGEAVAALERQIEEDSTSIEGEGDDGQEQGAEDLAQQLEEAKAEADRARAELEKAREEMATLRAELEETPPEGELGVIKEGLEAEQSDAQAKEDEEAAARKECEERLRIESLLPSDGSRFSSLFPNCLGRQSSHHSELWDVAIPFLLFPPSVVLDHDGDSGRQDSSHRSPPDVALTHRSAIMPPGYF